jgi:hypothetical protein
MSSAAEKMRRLRRRRAEGKIVVLVEVDIAVLEALKHDRLLFSNAEDDRAAVGAAVDELLRRYARAERDW